MFDHFTLRVTDLATASGAFTAVLDQLEIEQITSTPSFSVWGNFAKAGTRQRRNMTESDRAGPSERTPELGEAVGRLRACHVTAVVAGATPKRPPNRRLRAAH